MLRVVVSRRWLTALAVAALFAVACFFLGRWQWHRHEAKAATAERIDSHYSASPVPLTKAMPKPGVNLPQAQEWTMVTATGRYAAQHLMLVRNRPNNGVFGYEIVVPLELVDGSCLLVDRGWIPNGRTAAEPSKAPATPTGDVTVTGWLRLGEPSLGHHLSNGQLASINLPEAREQLTLPGAEVKAAAGSSLYGAYLIRSTETGPPGKQIEHPQPLERPGTSKGPHLAYALQWWLAAPVGVVLVLVGARREHLEGTNLPKPRKTRIWDEEDE